MSTPSKVVSKLLEDEDFSLEDIKSYVDGHPVDLAAGIEFHIGFAIETSDEHRIEANARDDGVEPDWEAINAAIGVIERNAENALNEVGIVCRNEGHSGTGELVGSAWVTGGTPGFQIVKTYIEKGEPFSTTTGTISGIKKGLELSLFHGVSADVARLIDVDISFFDLNKIDRVENGEELEEDDHAEDPKEFMTRAFTFDVGELKQRLLTELNLGSVVVHTVRNSSGSVSLFLYAAKKPVSQGKWDRENRIAGNEDGAISRIVYDWIESKGGLLLDRQYLICRKHFQKFAEYRLIQFLFRPPAKTVQIVGDDNDKTVV